MVSFGQMVLFQNHRRHGLRCHCQREFPANAPKKWGEWEGVIRQHFENQGMARVAITENILAQLASWVKNKMNQPAGSDAPWLLHKNCPPPKPVAPKRLSPSIGNYFNFFDCLWTVFSYTLYSIYWGGRPSPDCFWAVRYSCCTQWHTQMHHKRHTQSNNLSWSFFFCHSFLCLFASRRGIVYQSAEKVRFYRSTSSTTPKIGSLLYTSSFFLGSAIDHVMLPKSHQLGEIWKYNLFPVFKHKWSTRQVTCLPTAGSLLHQIQLDLLLEMIAGSCIKNLFAQSSKSTIELDHEIFPDLNRECICRSLILPIKTRIVLNTAPTAVGKLAVLQNFTHIYVQFYIFLLSQRWDSNHDPVYKQVL